MGLIIKGPQIFGLWNDDWGYNSYKSSSGHPTYNWFLAHPV